MLHLGSRRRFLQHGFGSLGLIAASSMTLLSVFVAPRTGSTDKHSAAEKVAGRLNGAESDIVMVNGWILRRSDLEHLR